MFDLIRRFCRHDLDQWENWQVSTTHGPVYITVTRRPPAGVSPEGLDAAFVRLPSD